MKRKYEMTYQEVQNVVDTFIKHNIDYTKFLRFDETNMLIFDEDSIRLFTNYIFQNYSNKDFNNFPDDLDKAFKEVTHHVFNEILGKYKDKNPILDRLSEIVYNPVYDKPIDHTILKEFYGDNFEELFLDANNNIELFKKPFEMYKEDKQNKDIVNLCCQTFSKVALSGNNKALTTLHGLYVKEFVEMNGF